MISHYINVIFFTLTLLVEAVAHTCSVKKMFIKNFTKFTGKHLCQSLFFNKVAGLRTGTLLKERLWHSCFPVNFAKFVRTPFLTEHLRWLLLYLVYTYVSLIPASFIFSIKLCQSLSNLLVLVWK